MYGAVCVAHVQKPASNNGPVWFLFPVRNIRTFVLPTGRALQMIVITLHTMDSGSSSSLSMSLLQYAHTVD